MSIRTYLRPVAACATVLATAALLAGPALAFDIGFDWAGLKSCATGKAPTVASPAFDLKDVPKGTQYIRFKMVDRDVPDYNHGGGVVKWAGEAKIPAGAFKYKAPCPPNGVHTYEWTASAQSKKNGGLLGQASAKRKYPE
ncbi:MAG: hypothetical protein WAT09_08545 [Paracoccaceae bacterium]